MSTISDEPLDGIAKAIARSLEAEMRIVRAEFAQERAAIATALAEAKALLAEDRLKLRDMLAETQQRPAAAKLFKAG